MKINPIGIHSYQQLTRRDNPANAAPASDELSKTDSSVTISPQADGTGSRLAIKAPKGSYAEFLTPQERKALEILFRRFHDTARFGPEYQEETEVGGEHGMVGSIIDVKV